MDQIDIDEYLDWLLNYVYSKNLHKYKKVLKKLLLTDFIPENVYEGNRATEGLYFRESYYMTKGIKFPKKQQCSMLEMIVGIAERLVIHHMGDDDMPKWFWMMICNMGLDITNMFYNESKVERIVKKFHDKKFCKNGKGSLFIVKDKKTDMRKTDIDGQMHAWLCEMVASDN